MAAQPVVAKWRYIQYNGSNSAEIIAEANVGFVSESNGVLMVQVPPGDGWLYTINLHDYVLYYENAIGEIDTSVNEFTRRWRCDQTCDEVTAAIATPLRGIGVAAVPTVPASETVTVSVTVAPAMADANYSATAQLFAGIDIGSLQVNSVTVIDSDTVDVVVENTGVDPVSGVNVLVSASA